MRLVGGADVTLFSGGEASVAQRNVERELVGGSSARTVAVHVGDGRMRVSSGGQWTDAEWLEAL